MRTVTSAGGNCGSMDTRPCRAQQSVGGSGAWHRPPIRPPISRSLSVGAASGLTLRKRSLDRRHCLEKAVALSQPVLPLHIVKSSTSAVEKPSASPRSLRVTLAELWRCVVSTWGNLPRALEAAGLDTIEAYDQEQLRTLCRNSFAEPERAEKACDLLWRQRGRSASPILAESVTRATLLFSFARYSPRQTFGDWANRMLLTYDNLAELAGFLAAGGRPHVRHEALPIKDWERTGQMPISRQAFLEALACLEVHLDDAAAWFETLCDASREALDFGKLTRRMCAWPQIDLDADMDIGDDTTAFKERSTRQLLSPDEVAVRLIHAWGDFSSAFGLRPTSSGATDKRRLGVSMPPRSCNSTPPRLSTATLRQERDSMALNKSAQRAALGQEQWERALRGPSHVRLLPEAAIHTEAAGHMEELERRAAAENVVSGDLFPNVSERLCVSQNFFLPNQPICVRYSNAEHGFFGAGMCKVASSTVPSNTRRNPVGAKPFLALTPVGAEVGQVCVGQPELRVPIDPRARCGVVSLRAPISSHTGGDGLWQLQVCASDDGENVFAKLGTPLKVKVSPMVPAVPGRPDGIDATRSLQTGWCLTVTWAMPADVPEEDILRHELGVWNINNCSEDVAPLQTHVGQDVFPPFCVQGLQPATRYTFRVRCETFAGLSAWSLPSRPLSTLSAQPDKLATPEVFMLRANEATVRWPTASIEVTRYEVTVQPIGDVDDVSPWVVAVEPPPPPSEMLQACGGDRWTEAVISGLLANSDYCFFVRATNAYGSGPQSDSSPITRTIPGAPNAPSAPSPTGCSFTNLASQGYELMLAWKPPNNDGGSPVVRYFVRGVSDKEGEEVVQCSTRGMEPMVSVRELQGNTRYVFRVYALNSAGLSLASAPSEPVQTGPVPPGVPRAVSVVGTEETTVSLQWEQPADDGGAAIQKYQLEIQEVVDPSGEQVSAEEAYMVETPEPNITLTGLRGNSQYCCRVRAVNVVSASPYVEIMAHTDPVTPGAPGVPRLVGEVRGGKVTLSWSAPAESGGSAIVGYSLVCNLCEPDGSPAAECQFRVQTSNTRVDVTGLQPDSVYRFYAQARSACAGLGDASQWSRAVRVPPLPLGPPEAPTMVAATSQTLVVTWPIGDTDSAQGDADLSSLTEVTHAVLDYEVGIAAMAPECVDDATEGPMQIALPTFLRTIRTMAPPLRFRGLQPMTSYTFALRRRSKAGWSQWSLPSEPYQTNDVWTKQEAARCIVSHVGGSVAEVFRVVDGNCDGFVTYEDFRDGLERCGITWLPEAQLIEIFADMNPDLRGSVSMRAFVKSMLSSAAEEEQPQYALAGVNLDGIGHVTDASEPFSEFGDTVISASLAPSDGVDQVRESEASFAQSDSRVCRSGRKPPAMLVALFARPPSRHTMPLLPVRAGAPALRKDVASVRPRPRSQPSMATVRSPDDAEEQNIGALVSELGFYTIGTDCTRDTSAIAPPCGLERAALST